MTIQQLSQSNRLTNTMAYICFFFFTFYPKVIYIAVRLNRHSFSDQKTVQGLKPNTLRSMHFRATSLLAYISAHSGDPLALNCSWECDLLFIGFVFCCMMSSEHRRRKDRLCYGLAARGRGRSAVCWATEARVSPPRMRALDPHL